MEYHQCEIFTVIIHLYVWSSFFGIIYMFFRNHSPDLYLLVSRLKSEELDSYKPN